MRKQRHLAEELLAAQAPSSGGEPEGRGLSFRTRLTAALIGTIAANFFYLTMQFYYFYAFCAFVLALPVVFGGIDFSPLIVIFVIAFLQQYLIPTLVRAIVFGGA